jgi:hypothetical protein
MLSVIEKTQGAFVEGIPGAAVIEQSMNIFKGQICLSTTWR